MVFIRKRLIEDEEVTTTTNSGSSTSGGSDEETGMSDEEFIDLVTDEENALDRAAALANEAAPETSENKVYNWNEILTILSDYVNPSAVQQIKDDWTQTYPDGTMDEDSVDDLISDVAVSFNEEIASEIKSRIDQLQSNSVNNYQDYYSNFEKSFIDTSDSFNNGLISKLEYLGQAGKLIHDFINGLQSFDETQRGELFNKAEELVNSRL